MVQILQNLLKSLHNIAEFETNVFFLSIQSKFFYMWLNPLFQISGCGESEKLWREVEDIIKTGKVE